MLGNGQRGGGNTYHATLGGETHQRGCPPKPLLIGDANRTQFSFLKLFGPLRDIPAKSREYLAKKPVALGFEGHSELFGPRPFTRKTLTPPEDIQTQKFGFVLLFLA